jgi:hypothetical protein
LVLCTPGTITEDARRQIEDGTVGERRRGAPIRFWDGLDLAGFIEKHWLEGFAQVAGLDLDRLRPAVLVQDILAAGVALAKGGQPGAAIPLLEKSLWNAALWLGTAHLLEGTDPAAMLRAARTLIEFDKSHYNQFWLAGYAEFRLGHHPSAASYLNEALRLLDLDDTEQVRRGAGFQERYVQTLAMLIEIGKRSGEDTTELERRYREKHRFVATDLGWAPRPLGAWEVELQTRLGLTSLPG